MGKWRRPSQPPDYEVGYGRPPESTRFQPGRSGNPSGRPRKQKTVGALLQQALSRRVKIQEDGVTKCLSVEQIALTRLANKAAKGDLRAVKLIYELKERYSGSTGEQPFEIRLLPGDENL
jgi:hypothetical protein